MMETKLREQIERVFAGVMLASGVSLRQAEVMDNYGEGCTQEEFERLPLEEVTKDWRQVPIEELEARPYLAHLDSAGFRYYIPAFNAERSQRPRSLFEQMDSDIAVSSTAARRFVESLHDALCRFF